MGRRFSTLSCGSLIHQGKRTPQLAPAPEFGTLQGEASAELGMGHRRKLHQSRPPYHRYPPFGALCDDLSVNAESEPENLCCI